MNVTIDGTKKIRANIKIPPDKSISHRAIMIGSIAKGISEIDNFLFSDDCISTINCYKKLGVEIQIDDQKIRVKGRDFKLLPSSEPIDLKNSGTTTRLSLGILATQEFETVLDGDSSLRKRPMKRVTVPLESMGAKFEYIKEEDHLPIKVFGKATLSPIDYNLPIASAQVKSALLFASLKADGKSKISEFPISRNHTELMLEYAGANIKTYNQNSLYTIEISPSSLDAIKLFVPSDISSAAFFIVLALICENSEVQIDNVILNPTRTGLIDVLKSMGAEIYIENVKKQNNELIGSIIAKSSNLCGVVIKDEDIPRIIDEIPILSVAASFAEGKTIIDNVKELRVKESDRIKTTLEMLKNFGAECYELENGMVIIGSRSKLHPSYIESYNDHRIAMAASIMACAIKGSSTIKDAECASISFPNFYDILMNL